MIDEAYFHGVDVDLDENGSGRGVLEDFVMEGIRFYQNGSASSFGGVVVTVGAVVNYDEILVWLRKVSCRRAMSTL